MYSPITAIDVTAAYAVALPQVRQAQENAPPAASHTALVGVRVRLLILCQIDDPGSAPSRENA
jgi:hypothetical protein